MSLSDLIPKKTIICTSCRQQYTDRRIFGDCLEAEGIPSSGIVKLEHGTEVHVGDIVHCTKYAGMISSYLKKVLEIKNGLIIVGTAYVNPEKDFSFPAAEILGVAVEVMDDNRNVVWRRSDHVGEN